MSYEVRLDGHLMFKHDDPEQAMASATNLAGALTVDRVVSVEHDGVPVTAMAGARDVESY